MNVLHAMQLFVKSVEMGGFSAAGRVLRIAPSSISRHIGSLEHNLGVRLLHRTTRKLSLTEAGQIYYQRASQILLDMEQAHSAVKQLQSHPQGQIRLSVAVPFGEAHIVPLIPEFLRRYPEVSIDLSLQDRTVDLVEERVDLAIRIGKLDDSSLIARKLANNRYVVCGSNDYIRQHGLPSKPEDLVGFNCISLPRGNLWHFSRKLNRQQQLHKVTVSGNLHANTGGALLKSIRAHLGFAMLPNWLVAQAITDGELQVVLQEYEPVLASMTGSAIYALYPTSNYLPAKVRVFLDYLLECFNKNKALI